jgi:pimeloyl-ACP methyl ester carboxylesterase
MRCHALPCLILAFLVLLPTSTSAHAGAADAPLAATSCPFEVPVELRARIECGVVRVPESWDDPASRRIRVPFAVVRAANDAPRRDPVVWIGGGPMPDLWRVRQAATSQVWRDRDVVLFDFRGMGAGDAVCPESGPAYARVLTSRLAVPESLQARAQLAAECRHWAEAAGVDLAAYNARAIARDVVAIVEALGFERWGVDSGSFGTVVAQHLMRLEPAGLDAVVLRMAVPLQQESIHDNGFARAIDLMARDCAAEPACAAAFADPRDALQATFEQLEREPVRVRVPRVANIVPDGEVHITGTVLQRIVSDGLYRRVLVSVLPMLVAETARGNSAPIATIAWLAVQPGRDLNGVNWAAQCDASGAWAAGGPPLALDRADENYWRTELRYRCAELGVPPAPEAERQPVESALPTLLIVGEHDPITPPSYSAAIARHLGNARVLEIPGRGHEMLERCTDPIVAGFLDNPAAALDSTCLDALAAVPFITDLRPTRGAARLMLALQGGHHALLAALALPVLVLASSVAIAAVAVIARRLRRRPRPQRTPFERGLRRAATALSLLALGFAVALGLVIAGQLNGNAVALLVGVPTAAGPLLLMPWILVAGSVALLASVAIGWRQGRWTFGLVHGVVIAVATLVLGATLIAIGMV